MICNRPTRKVQSLSLSLDSFILIIFTYHDVNWGDFVIRAADEDMEDSRRF